MRVLYLSGEPGTGKTWLMTQLTDSLSRIPLPAEHGAPARDLLMAQAEDAHGRRIHVPAAVELGRQRPGGYSGTDALPNAVVTDACLYLTSGRAATEAPVLLAEGARLANRRFLCNAAHSGAEVVLLHLHAPETAARRRAARAAALGIPEQNPSWVKGRRTAAENLAREFTDEPAVRVILIDATHPPVHLLRTLLSPPP